MNTSTSGQRIQTVCMLILTAIAISAALYYLSSVLMPFVLAIFFTYCLGPVIDVQVKRLRMPRMLAILSTIILGCVILFAFSLLISAAVSGIADRSHTYQTRIEQLFQNITASLPLEKFGLDPEQLDPSLINIPRETVAGIIKNTVSGIMGIVSNGLLVLIFMIFMLTGKKTSTKPSEGIWHEIEWRTQRYLITMLSTSGLTGLLVGTTLALLGVEFAWMFGFLAFLLNFIPNIGSIIATLLPLPVILLNPELSPAIWILAIAIPMAIQFVIGNLVQPKIMGQSLDLHPVVVLLALIFFGIIWGIVGMFLATPITAVLKILFERIEYTRPVANVLAGRFDPQPEKI
ncbi:MAG: AI-2E family transporter [Planctomycetota bacterium]|jgi:AI-2 transport protein TqsA